MANNNRVEVHVGANTSDLKAGMKVSSEVVDKAVKEIGQAGKNVKFNVDLTGVEKNFAEMSRNVQSNMQKMSTNISNSFKQSFDSVSNSFRSMTSLFAGAVTVSSIIDMADGYGQMGAQIRNATTSAAEYNKVQDHLLETANTTYRSLEEAQQVYLDVGGALKAFGSDTEEALRITDSLSFSFTHNATASDKAKSATDAFMKSIYSNKVTGDAFVTMLSAIPSVVDDLSASMGKSKAEILTMGNAGQITGNQLKKAFNESREANEDLANKMENSVKDGLTVLRTELTVFIGKANETYAITGKISALLVALGKNISTVVAGIGAVAAILTTKYIVQMAASIKTTIVATIENIRHQASLAGIATQATATTTTMSILRGAMALLGGPVGLGLLAVQGVAAGAAFLYLKKSSSETTPALSTQGKSVTQLREEYERLDQAQRRVLIRQATADIDTATQEFKKQEIALLGLVRVVINHSEASHKDREAAKSLYEQYLQGKIRADQLATGINSLKTVEDKHKKSIDDKAVSVTNEKKAVSDAEAVLKAYNNTTRQSTSDNEKHTKSINDKADAYENLTEKQKEYINKVNQDVAEENYINKNMKNLGISRERAEHRAQARKDAGMGFSDPNELMPKDQLKAEQKSWDLKQQEVARTQATKAAADAEKKAEESKKRQVDLAEKQYDFKRDELKMLQRVAELSAKYDLDGIGAKYGIPKNYLAGLMAQESGGNPDVVSPTGAIGYFQTTGDYRKDNKISVADSKNLPVIAEVVAKNISSAFEKLGSWEAAIRSHNAGVAGSAKFEKTGRVNGSAARNREVAGFAPAVNKWIVGLGGSNLKSGGMSKASTPESISDYKAFEENKVNLAEKAEKEKLALQYKYADERKKIAIDLDNSIEEIENSKLSGDEKINAIIKAEKEAANQIKAIRIEQLEQEKGFLETELDGKILLAERIFAIEMAQLEASLKSGKISNVEKVRMARQLEEALYSIKRLGLEDRIALEQELGALTGNNEGLNSAANDVRSLDHEKTIGDIQYPGLMSDAEMQDFEDKFGGFTNRISGLWDKGMQSLMNGTLTWKNATNAVLADMGAYFLQTMVSEPLKVYMMGLSKRLAVRLGFIKTETAAEVTGQAAQTGAVVTGEGVKTAATATGVLTRLGLKAGEAIKSIMMYAWEAMAGAFKAMVSIPYIGPVLAVAAGASALALVGGLAGKIKSARGGYDIPAGVNPVTQLHEEEMVLPKQHANTIRALGRSMSNGGMDQPSMAGSGESYHFNLGFLDTKGADRWLKKNGRAMADALKNHHRNFGK
ncbi:tape measure protein [Acinetobacter rudis]|uniref:tape measure protein n=1 Tax=Acinetobacter rudis TaxID=632955 RepID=UPI003342A0C7